MNWCMLKKLLNEKKSDTRLSIRALIHFRLLATMRNYYTHFWVGLGWLRYVPPVPSRRSDLSIRFDNY